MKLKSFLEDFRDEEILNIYMMKFLSSLTE